MKSITIFLITALLLSGIGVTTAAAQTPVCGSTYVAQPGDYLFKIARQCGVTYANLLAANPQIANPSLIYPNQVINIPNGTQQVATVSITPTTGVIGTSVTLTATGWAINTNVVVSFGRVGGAFSQLDTTTTGATGTLSKQYIIPGTAGIVTQNGQYVFRVARADNANISAVSNPITISGVTAVTPTPGVGSSYYLVKPRDNLSRIAATFGTTVAAIMAVNPSIGSNFVIYAGQYILIPTTGSVSPSGATVTVTPTTAHAGGTLQVSAGNFPANADVDVRIAKQGQPFSAAVDATSSAQGTVTATINVPSSAVVGEQWVVMVMTTELLHGVVVTSLPITIN